MSTIIATTLSDGSVSVPTATVVNGSAKAWVNFNGTGTIAARDSFNVASLTDNGTGDYTVNFSNAFGAADYGITATCINSGSANSFNLTGNLTVAAGSIRGVVRVSNTATDVDYVITAIHGDLA